ncbi:hypothetical protein RvY_14376 [Ramazzottius varieornatus]|uniref:HTH psq-type domain-containing protein n=1 Tax=Ramazzottius varieornatus TaxID=947166 RepID=A0A1D1VUX3_RAMVA|nr:hypothetical protein RvY_14376 [Ramazzottius varieornatus]
MGQRGKIMRPYGEEDLMEAVEAVKSGMTLRAAEMKYGVCSGTIRNYLANHGRRQSKMVKMGRPPFMTLEEEEALVTILQEHRESTGQPLRTDEFQSLVLKYVKERLGRGRKARTCHEKWRRLFFKRHPEAKALMSLKRRSPRKSQTDIPKRQSRHSGKTKPVEGLVALSPTKKKVEISHACQHSCCRETSPAAPFSKDSSAMLLIRSLLVDNLNFNHTQAEAVLDFTIRTSKRGNTPQPTAARSSKAHARSVHIPPVAESEDEAMDEPEGEYVVKSVRVNNLTIYALPS